MGRKKKTDGGSEGGDRGRTPIGKQVNVRIPPDLLADLESIAKDSRLDLSSAIRMILGQTVPAYVRRMQERKQQEES